jgi:hypothetical protein
VEEPSPGGGPAKGAPAAHPIVGAKPVGASPIGAMLVGAMPVGAMPVWSSSNPLAATTAAPAAIPKTGSGVVTTGARSCSDSRWVTSGIAAPPPTVATAEILPSGIR